MTKNINVLFFQSQSFFGSDSMIHSLLMKNYDRDHVSVHVACNSGSRQAKSAALNVLETMPDIKVLATNFGPTKTGQTRSAIATQVPEILPAVTNFSRLARYVVRNRIDVIHGTEKPRDAFYGTVLSKLTGTKSVVHLHVKAEDWLSPLVVWAMQNCDAVVGVSQFVARSAVSKGCKEDRVYHVLNSIEAARWDFSIDGSMVRREFGIGSKTPLLGIASRLFYWKGHTELLKALAIVREEVPDVILMIVGEDDPRAHPGGGSYLDELMDLTHELGLCRNVVFTGFRSDIQSILAACDVYAMPTFEEPCAVAFLEAMAMKKPVIALDSGGTPELVEHGKSGLLSKPRDIEALAANILTLVNNAELRRRMGDYGRKRIEDYFNPQRMANETERVYRNILGSPN